MSGVDRELADGADNVTDKDSSTEKEMVTPAAGILSSNQHHEALLANNVDILTKVLEQQMLDNGDLKQAQHEIERKLDATMDRMKVLETALREVREDSMRERKRFEEEMDRTREAARQERLARLGFRTAEMARTNHARQTAEQPTSNDPEADTENTE